MAIKLSPYLNFSGNTQEAMEFYKSVFGGELTINKFSEYPDAQPPEGYADKAMHARLIAGDIDIMASDGQPGGEVVKGDNFSLSLSGDDAEKLQAYFSALGEGGQVVMPLDKQMWGDVFGMLIDKFGISWMVNIDQP